MKLAASPIRSGVELRCDACDRLVEVEALDPKSNTARCPECRASIEPSRRLPKLRGRSAQKRALRRVRLERRGRVVRREGNYREPGLSPEGAGLDARVAWSYGWSSVLLALGLTGFGIALLVIGEPRHGDTTLSWINGVLWSLISYLAWAGVFNATTIRATPSMLTVKYGPLPWFKRGRRVETSSIEKIVIDRELVQGRKRPLLSYRVRAVLRDGGVVELLAPAEIEVARQVEGALDELLAAR